MSDQKSAAAQTDAANAAYAAAQAPTRGCLSHGYMIYYSFMIMILMVIIGSLSMFIETRLMGLFVGISSIMGTILSWIWLYQLIFKREECKLGDNFESSLNPVKGSYNVIKNIFS